MTAPQMIRSMFDALTVQHPRIAAQAETIGDILASAPVSLEGAEAVLRTLRLNVERVEAAELAAFVRGEITIQ